MGETTKFHGMQVVEDYNLNAVKGHDVIEVTSNGDIVCRYYDKEGNEQYTPMVINVTHFCICNDFKKITEATITGFIKKTVGKKSLIISASAIKAIRDYIS